MDDLIAFITARLNEDEAVAKAATPGPWTLDEWTGGFGRCASVMVPIPQHPGAKTGLTQLARVPSMDAETAGHIARHDPARVLREVAAKRVMLGELEAQASVIGGSGPYRHCLEIVSRALAAVWSDHPDYRPEWKP